MENFVHFGSVAMKNDKIVLETTSCYVSIIPLLALLHDCRSDTIVPLSQLER